MSRYMGVHQNVLEPFCAFLAERPHAVARLSGANQQRQLDEVAIEVTDLVTGLERRGITGAGRDYETRGRLGPGCGARRRLAPTKSLHLEEARVGDQPADEAPLQGRRQLRKRGAVADESVGQVGDRLIEKAVFFTQDVGGACQQLARGGVEGINRREKLLPQATAGKSRVLVARIPPRREVESRQVGLDLTSGDVEERPRQVPVTTAHRS